MFVSVYVCANVLACAYFKLKHNMHKGLPIIFPKNLPIILILFSYLATVSFPYCILRGRIKGFNRSITTILFEVGSYRTVVG